jgi:hypothetical protein
MLSRLPSGQVLRPCRSVQQRNLDPAKVFTQSTFSAVPFLPPPAGFLINFAGVPPQLLSSFYCLIDNSIRLIVTMFQL